MKELTPGDNPHPSPPYAGVSTFLDGEYCDDLDGVDVAVLGIPADSTGSNRPGARFGPQALRAASDWWGYAVGFEGQLTNARTGERVDHNQYTLADCGDVPVVPTDVKRTADRVEEVTRTLTAESFPVILGGDHYWTEPVIRGLTAGLGVSDLGIVQIDAHTDTVERSDVYGDAFHGSWLYRLIDAGIVDYDDVSQLGLRAYERANHQAFVDDVGMTTYSPREMRATGIESATRDAIEDASASTDGVYITVDADVLDPSVAPGVGNPVPGGLTADELLRTIEVIAAHDRTVGIDLMEITPPHDPTGMTARVGAHLLLAFLEGRFAIPCE